MKPPKSDDEYDGRIEDCIIALRDRVVSATNQAVTAGWGCDDVGAALIEIGDMLIGTTGYDALCQLEDPD